MMMGISSDMDWVQIDWDEHNEKLRACWNPRKQQYDSLKVRDYVAWCHDKIYDAFEMAEKRQKQILELIGEDDVRIP